ncbi:B12-binding domain-containing radical SAM protein [Agrobacterium sp. SHOUNA12C]|uniref:Radical SAM core domain-containing protein n=1 Tax=Rhizobium rhizogenes NBRC 13257 TaxID=1220581 RepID=A0AA87QDZ6_RHIRH|nr:radical SAM protein [Rhizobium rhizogenes]MCJ9720476.1 B12-binding domain-containing radical SAM protein [Agrobacterium sp. BETTINA12B]MCJ9757193.1 B12-binding domain-containing radical SAM protein [Agrobacterium sp. SHOUNA12C]NTF51599.1 B12-binding domain-containing radical SAM protein [Rhizobium rhizogenes]NTF58129.1 B12-binding domain-containing radical SAM protein [Rhizobium rhizogenes]NTF64547.1 B12-binding domain-containing radical SAM protein [Rhizobium rhizogenes]
MAHIVIINPRFETSYWGLEHALPLFDVKANLPVACLPLLAALTPAEHTVTLVDENVEPIDYDLCAQADIVALTGMIVQRFRMTEILTALRARHCFIVVGGPWVTVKEDYFDGLIDVKFIGEAEETWPQFLLEWKEGRHTERYEQSGKTDMSTVPVPRFDLLKMDDYAVGSIQFSRGCPFTCDFCDIIVVFGRKPRIKTSVQIIAEIEALLAVGMDTAFIVDDNLIGNKKAIKEVLREVVAWQERHHYPMTFLTEASIDLADDAELMQLMVDANIRVVFVGIETPNEEALRETKKLQNLRKGGTMLDKIHAIQQTGMEVWCGMILGFDSDDATIFEAQRVFIKDARIVNAMIGMLAAIPKTPLYTRLEQEGRLDHADPPAYGTNVIPLNLSRETLRNGYLAVLSDLHQPAAYFDRLDALYLDARIQPERTRLRHLRRHPLRLVALNVMWALEAIGIFTRLMRRVPEADLRNIYRQRLWKLLLRRRSPVVLQIYAIKCAMHYHAHLMVQQMRTGGDIVNSF